MKTNSILIKEGKAFAVCEEIPKEPRSKAHCGGTHACTCAALAFERGANRDVVDGYDDNCPYRYAAALQRVKDNAVEIHEDDLNKAAVKVLKLIRKGMDLQDAVMTNIEEGELYPLSVEVEIKDDCECANFNCLTPCALNDKHCKRKRLARIVEEPEEKTKIPHFVTVTEHSIKNGYTHDKERAQQYLEVGKKYEIVEERVDNWHTTVWLREFPGLAFNSVNFEPFQKLDMYRHTPTIATDHTVAVFKKDSEVEDQEVGLIYGIIQDAISNFEMPDERKLTDVLTPEGEESITYGLRITESITEDVIDRLNEEGFTIIRKQ